MQLLNCHRCGRKIYYSNGGLKKRIAKSQVLCFDCEELKVAREMAKIRKSLDKGKKVC